MAKNSDSEFLLVYFKNTNEYKVIEDKNHKFINSKKKKIKEERRWYTGEIKYRGKKMEIGVLNLEKITSESVIESVFNAISSRKTYESVEIDNLDSISNNYQESIASSTSDIEAKCSKYCSCSGKINEMNEKIENLDKKIENMDKKVDKMLDLFQTFIEPKKRKYSEEDFQEELMFDGKNLLDICASTQSKYVTSLMEILFTTEERQNGIIAGDKSTSKRIRLNEDKVKLLKDAIMIKYKVPKDKNEETWKECKEIANRKCFDTKK